MGELNYKNNAVYDIEAPDIPDDRDKRIRVLLHTDEHIVLDNVAEHSLTVYRTEYHLSLRNMAQDFELTLTAADNTPVGALIYIDFANASSEASPHTLTVKEGETTVATVATSLESTTGCMFMYTGNGFVLMGGTASPEEGESQETPDVEETVVLQAQLQDGVPYELNGEVLANAKMIVLDLDGGSLSSDSAVSLPAGDGGPAEGAIIRINGENPLVNVQGCTNLENMNGIETAYAIKMNGQWYCFAKVELEQNGGQASMEAVLWDLNSEPTKTVGGKDESEVHVSMGGTCGGMASLSYSGTPKDGYKLYLTNTEPQNNASDTIDVMGKQVPLCDLMGTRVFVFANGMWN